MKLVSILYDDMYDETDIIAIPDDLFEDLDNIVNRFEREWPYENEDYILKFKKNENVIGVNLETDGFVRWLNKYYCIHGEKAKVVMQNVPHKQEYYTIEF